MQKGGRGNWVFPRVGNYSKPWVLKERAGSETPQTKRGEKASDEGGDKGGQIVAEGTPKDIMKVKKSYTGKYLNPILQ